MATQPTGAPLNANKISIVTKSEIRYEGILYHINPQDQNITLCNVKSFGTEGRRPGDEIAPSPQVHEYIIFRGSDIKDLKVLEAAPQTDAQAQAGDAPKDQQQQQATNVQAPNEEKKESAPRDFKMNQGSNQEDFDFQGMQQKFQQVALEHKQTDVHAYEHDDFFDSLSTSTAEKTRELPFDRIAQKKVDKETFGSEYVDTATQRSRGFRRGGGRGRGYGGRGGGQGRNYGGQNRNYEGGQNRGYGGQNRNYEGGDNRGYQGENRGYGGGENRGYGGGENRGYGGQNRGYGGGQNRGYGGGQHRNYEGGQNRNYEGGQNRNYEGGQNGGYGGGQNRGYGGGQNRRYGGGEQGGGYKNYQNEQTFGQGDMNKDEGKRYGNN